MKRVSILFTVCIVVLSACKKNLQERILIDIYSECKKKECVINIKNVTDFNWNRMYIFSVQASQEEMNKAMGFTYNGWSDLTSQIVFTLNDSIVYVEKDSYDPDAPSKINFGEDNDTAHCMMFTPATAIFRVHKEPIKKVCYTLLPIK